MKEDNFSLSTELTDDSTIKPFGVDTGDHVKINSFIFGRDEAERPPFQFKCDCCSETLQCDRSISVFFFQYFLIGVIALLSLAYLAFT